MDITPILKWLEATPVSNAIRNSLYFFPFLEAIHVIALALVFGTIVVIDLRALGFASTKRGFAKMATDTLKWTWAAFALAFLTGALMFSYNAEVYAVNTFFRIKMVLLLAAGINMLVFQLTCGRTMHEWSDSNTAPPIGKVGAALSLLLWVGIIFMGRSIGFTTTGQAAKLAAPPPSNVDFNSFLGGDSNTTASNTTVPSNSAAPAEPAGK